MLDVTEDRDALADVELFGTNALFVELLINVEPLTEVVVVLIPFRIVVVVAVAVGAELVVLVVLASMASGINIYSSFQISKIIISDIQNNYSGYLER